MSSSALDEDANLAAELARIASQYLLELRDTSGLAGARLGIAGDRGANGRILTILRDRRPDDAILSEESADSPDRLKHSRVWIIDPVDGTREYGEERHDWAVHVALAIDGIARIGAVALPALDLVMRSDRPVPLPREQTPPRMVVSRSRPPAEALEIARKIGADLVPMGSAGAKAMAVARGQAEIYLHSGGQFEWDNAAPVAVASAWGLHCSRLDGTPMRYNRPDPRLGDLLICRPSLRDEVLSELALLRSRC